MKVLILAAGRGTRISRYLSGKPKCTVDIGGGQCLIEYTIDLLHSRGIQDIGIVLGYEAQVIREVLADKGVSFFYNPFYDVTNSIASAWFAKEFLMGDDLLIMNGDVYLEEKLLDRILAQGRSPVMFADESRRETADYKFFYEDGILKKYGKELTGDDVTGEYIGIGRFSAAFMPEFICRMEEMIDRQEHGVWWENVVYSMTGQQPVYVEGAPQQAGKIPPCLLIDHRLAGGHQPQMPLGQRHAFHARHIAEHWHLTVALNGAFQQLEVGVAVDAINDHAGDIEGRIKMLKAHHRGGDGGRDRFAIHQQNHRAAKLFGHRRAAAVVGVGAVAVIEAHPPFNDCDIGLLELVDKQRVEYRGGKHKAVEIAGGDAADGGVPGGV